MADAEDERTDGLEVAVEEREAWQRRLTITVPPERVRGRRRRVRKELGRSRNLKGFRPGKIPPAVVEQRFGDEIDRHTVRSLVEEAYREALQQKGLQPVGEVEIGRTRYEKGESLTFQAEFEVMPTLELERTGGFRVDRPEIEVDEEGVEEILGDLLDENATWKPVERRPGPGDRVSVRIASTPESGEAEEDGGANPYRFELGEGQAIPDVEEAIGTLEPGESGDFEATFPPDFGDDELAGATRRLHIELIDVKEKERPPLDDAFAAEVGDFESVEALREAVEQDLRRHREEEAERQLRKQLLDRIVEANPFRVSDAMVDRYLDSMIDAPEDADPGEVRAARERFRESAREELRRQLVMDHLLENDEFAVDDEELEAELRRMADERGEDVATVRSALAREDGLERLRRRMEVDRVFEDLKSRSDLA